MANVQVASIDLAVLQEGEESDPLKELVALKTNEEGGSETCEKGDGDEELSFCGRHWFIFGLAWTSVALQNMMTLWLPLFAVDIIDQMEVSNISLGFNLPMVACLVGKFICPAALNSGNMEGVLTLGGAVFVLGVGLESYGLHSKSQSSQTIVTGRCLARLVSAIFTTQNAVLCNNTVGPKNYSVFSPFMMISLQLGYVLAHFTLPLMSAELSSYVMIGSAVISVLLMAFASWLGTKLRRTPRQQPVAFCTTIKKNLNPCALKEFPGRYWPIALLAPLCPASTGSRSMPPLPSTWFTQFPSQSPRAWSEFKSHHRAHASPGSYNEEIFAQSNDVVPVWLALCVRSPFGCFLVLGRMGGVFRDDTTRNWPRSVVCCGLFCDFFYYYYYVLPPYLLLFQEPRNKQTK